MIYPVVAELSREALGWRRAAGAGRCPQRDRAPRPAAGLLEAARHFCNVPHQGTEHPDLDGEFLNRHHDQGRLERRLGSDVFRNLL
jgi:hypothetical protein